MYDRMNRLVAALTTGLHERDESVRLGLLASMAGESMFLLGPPGVGKSLVARRLQMVFAEAKSFSYLMGRFSTPDEVFGPLSIQRLKQDDRYERVITNYLPDADVVFLDEIWKASAPIRNALLTALNERLYRNGSQEIELPLKVFIGASNELPEDDDTAAAFWDRFLIRLVLGPIEDADSFRALLDDTSDVYADVVRARDKISTEEYGRFQESLLGVIVPEPVSRLLLDIRNRLRADGDAATGNEARYVSDRRWKKIVRLLRASALLHGRTEVQPLDCAIVRHCVWDSQGDREAADRTVMDALSRHAGNPDAIGAFKQRLANLDEKVLSESIEVIDEETVQPTIHREEYYRLTGGETTEDASHRVLVWHGDIDELAVDTEGEVDLFRYDGKDQLVGSDTTQVRRLAAWLLEVDGAEWEIETENRIASTTRSRELGQAEQDSLLAEGRALTEDIRSATDLLLAERSAIEDQATAHLFVTRAYAGIVTDAMEAAAGELVRIRIEAEQLMGQLQVNS
jgi:MoxR-like ATPase